MQTANYDGRSEQTADWNELVDDSRRVAGLGASETPFGACANGLIGIQVAEHVLGRPAREIYSLMTGPGFTGAALVWVFDFSAGGRTTRRCLRFWLPEVQLHASKDVSVQGRYCGWRPDWVIAKILPEAPEWLRGAEVERRFQIRPNMRRALPELRGETPEPGNRYQRSTLADFLRSHWMGEAKHKLSGALQPEFQPQMGTDGHG